MKDKTILEIASSKRVQDAFIARLSPTEEEKLKPKQFTANKIVEHIRGIVEAHEADEVARIARENYNSTKQEIIL